MPYRKNRPSLGCVHCTIITTLALIMLTLAPGTHTIAHAEDAKLEKKWKVTAIGDHTKGFLGFIKFDGSYVEGQSTCNSYSGVFETKPDQKIIIHRIAVTQLICKIGNKMELEKKYIDGLETATTYQIENDELVLLNKQNTVIARFK